MIHPYPRENDCWCFDQLPGCHLVAGLPVLFIQLWFRWPATFIDREVSIFEQRYPRFQVINEQGSEDV
jgi:hypothetical protein